MTTTINMSTLPASVPQTHPAVAIVGIRQPLQLTTVPTTPPGDDEVLIHVTWTGATPLGLHRADGGLLVDKTPFIMGSSFGGTVVALGNTTTTTTDSTNPHLREGDQVFGFGQDGDPKQAGHQTYITVPAWRVSKLPRNLTLAEAVSTPENLVTALHVLTADLGLELPWPVPRGWTPPRAEEPILVWGAASSVGTYALQVLKHWGYREVWAVASGKHHGGLRELGAKECFDYRKPGVVEEILAYVERSHGRDAKEPRVPSILDCIGSREGTLRPLSKIAEPGSTVAIMLPVINVHACKEEAPDYEMDVNKVLPGEWAEGVQLKGTRTHHYAKVSYPPEFVASRRLRGLHANC